MRSSGNVTLTCKNCGSEFVAWESHGRQYCSVECGKLTMGKRHGESYSRLHQIWCQMKTRCLCPTVNTYVYYGGRGITVCQEWIDSFEAFRDWAKANGYSDALELDRINVNGNYEPSNCRWATRVQQMRNTRKRRNAKTSKFKGVSKHSQNGCWVAQAHESRRTKNLGSFGSELKAALAYDDYVYQRDPDHAFLNFPERKRSRTANIALQ